MRTLVIFLRAAGLAALFAAAATAAPPPPPPPPPESMPREFDGYDTYLIYSNYYRWISARLGRARSEVLRTAPAPRELSQHYRAEAGPSVRVFNGEAGGETHGYDFRVDHWCRHQGGCVWLARRTTVRHRALGTFLEENFDYVRAVAQLKQSGVAPEEVRERGAQSYGLADPLTNALDYIDVEQATSAECARIDEALAVAESRARELRVSRDVTESDEPATPPFHAYTTEITLPDWYARTRGDRSRASYAEITLIGRDDERIVELINDITAPIFMCEQFR